MKIAKDKILHFFVNMGLAMTGFLSYWFAAGLCIGASVGKEYGDSKAYQNHWDWMDIVADMLGMAAGLLIVWGIRSLIGY